MKKDATKKLFEFKECPIRHKSDDRYTFHCVDCGELLLKYQYIWNGYDHPERGKALINNWCHEDLGGLRCEKCFQRLKRFVEEYYYVNMLHRSLLSISQKGIK
jgi:hypothetical protein